MTTDIAGQANHLKQIEEGSFIYSENRHTVVQFKEGSKDQPWLD